MECMNTNRGLSRYVDGLSSPAERKTIERHLSRCRPCNDRAADFRHVRSALRDLPRLTPSDHLQTRLRVLASRDRVRRVTRLTFAQKWTGFRDRTRLMLHNLMRPLMLPVFGGFASACILFGLLVPDIGREVHPISNDVPAPVLFTQASVNYLVPMSISDSEIELDVHVDDSGRMVDYQVLKGQNVLRDDLMRRRLESSLLITQFVPATTFGQPTPGRVRVRVVRDEIDVKG